jgi:hypothetical protein
MEQALVFASIILGVAISDQVLSLHRLLRTNAPVRWHWAQPWFAVIVLMTDMMIWWAIAGNTNGPISIGAFLPQVVQLILLALLTVSTLPDAIPAEGVDLADYYQRNRRYQWILLALAFAWGFLIDIVEVVRRGDEFAPFALGRWQDMLGLALIVAMGFIARWRGVFIGLLLTSLPTLLWTARTIS